MNIRIRCIAARTFCIAALCAAAFLQLPGCGGGEKPKRRARARDTEDTQVARAPEPKPAENKPAAPAGGGSGAGWGNIKGRVVWGGANLPERPPLKIEKDKDWCEKGGPVLDPKLIVDPKTKGVRNVFAYLRKPSAVHPDYPKTAADVKAADEKKFEELNKFKLAELDSKINEKAQGKEREAFVKTIKAPALIDQEHCLYVPHAVAAREGQTVLALNGEPVSHNILVASVGGANGSNINMPPGSVNKYPWKTESQPLNIKCSIHGWMEMFAMVFDHPYFAVTGDDGSFELKNVPAGDLTLIMRDPAYIDAKSGKVGKEYSKGATITVKAGETVDLGEIKYSP